MLWLLPMPRWWMDVEAGRADAVDCKSYTMGDTSECGQTSKAGCKGQNLSERRGALSGAGRRDRALRACDGVFRPALTPHFSFLPTVSLTSHPLFLPSSSRNRRFYQPTIASLHSIPFSPSRSPLDSHRAGPVGPWETPTVRRLATPCKGKGN